MTENDAATPDPRRDGADHALWPLVAVLARIAESPGGGNGVPAEPRAEPDAGRTDGPGCHGRADLAGRGEVA